MTRSVLTDTSCPCSQLFCCDTFLVIHRGQVEKTTIVASPLLIGIFANVVRIVITAVLTEVVGARKQVAFSTTGPVGS
jgi:hypothetical protein